ncbi:MAG: acyltransferase, partial [Muribaculaceae bacterium]|nr:acyltransferase [Muribaculaceae bacterium]
FKGRVHFAIGQCINRELGEMRHLTDKVDIVRRVCALIDREIHLGYRIYPINYIAYDRVNGTSRFASEYTAEDEARFDEYLSRQLDKVDLPDICKEERDFMETRILEMYANPLRNRLVAEGQEFPVKI